MDIFHLQGRILDDVPTIALVLGKPIYILLGYVYEYVSKYTYTRIRRPCK
jgi:hypothetical protein